MHAHTCQRNRNHFCLYIYKPWSSLLAISPLGMGKELLLPLFQMHSFNVNNSKSESNWTDLSALYFLTYLISKTAMKGMDFSRWTWAGKRNRKVHVDDRSILLGLCGGTNLIRLTPAPHNRVSGVCFDLVFCCSFAVPAQRMCLDKPKRSLRNNYSGPYIN